MYDSIILISLIVLIILDLRRVLRIIIQAKLNKRQEEIMFFAIVVKFNFCTDIFYKTLI